MVQMSEETPEREQAVTALEQARDAWGAYIWMTDGYPSPESVHGKLADALVMLANDLHPDDEDGFSSFAGAVTARPAALLFDLSPTSGYVYVSSTALYGINQHFSQLVSLLTWLAATYDRQDARRLVADTEQRTACGELRQYLTAVTRMCQDHAMGPVTRQAMHRVESHLLLMGTRLERAQDETLSSIEQRRRLSLIQVAQVRTLAAIERVQHAVYQITRAIESQM